MSKDIRIIREDCCNIWNNLKDKTQMIDYLIESKQQIADLEAKLAESEKKLSLVKNTSIYKTQMEITHLRIENADLKQQLAEKENEIERLQYTVDFYKSYYISFKEKVIHELEKVKELCKKKFAWWENSEWEGNIYDKSDVSNAYFDIEANIDNQIEELKKEKGSE